ncbi:circularly permuted type 2 ATP-grasp protein [Microbacterium telephonicum]|uniref:Putative circularly permuted ATP-grasp superfamily protein n=1 Tax=Microbacterium telephonicum TaxID=1714841 RepID=A0A498BSQ6_9MICO|nr:circularly permuted type 2 ATP-grasp protein [Microbacterium telephonicum]RLK46735.1 putative circularly permuted ATP-grasp superfamily protein [Microbacterium telephonicum]
MSVLRDYAATVAQPTLPFSADTARYDEVVDADGSLRAGWKALAAPALELTPSTLQRIEGEITRFLADDGVSYARPEAGAQPWQLDPFPFVVDAAAWATLDVGLAQRAELLNAVLVDLYGERTLLERGIIPAAAVTGHSGFARPLARASAVDPHPLILSAADLGRDADGEWHVLADRVQAPSGLGFAMENRRVMSQVLPDLYQEGSLHRVEPYFSAVHAALLSSAPEGVTDPRVVILSPGTLSETAFDQAFLANALGFPLVQGGDLVVRDGFVWMKPAGWPAKAPVERIDVIVRRVDAEWCDPLELRGDSRLGVAGLAEAVRRGHVRLVNGLGAGVLENPALMPYLPAACEHLLGEQLRLPSTPTWWCGDAGARESVLARLRAEDPTLFVRPIDRPRSSLAGRTPAELADLIAAAPHRYVGQELLPLSQAPSWRGGTRAGALPIVLRGFTLRYGSVYRPLVGGLVTMRESTDAPPVSKDVWVLKADEADPDQGLAELDPLPASRTVPSLAPRALADLFWSGRYAERAEDLLRLVLTAQQQIDRPGTHTTGIPADAVVLLQVIARLAGRAAADPEAEFRSLLLDGDRPGSAAHSIAHLRDALSGVRDQLSGDTWRVFSQVERAVRALRVSPHPHRSQESAGRMLSALLSLYGVSANMVRDPGWHMMEAGRALERALQVCEVLAAGVIDRRDPREEREVLEGLLIASESIVTYRRRYRAALRVPGMLDLLLLDDGNPRSIAFSLAAVQGHLAAMPSSTGSSRPERLLEHLIRDLAAVDVAALGASTGGRRRALEPFLLDLLARLEQLADSIADLHFEVGPPPVSLSSLALIEEMEARA